MTIRGLVPGEAQRGLLLHSEPGEVMDLLCACEGIAWSTATSGSEVHSALQEHRPSIVFSMKHSGFPGDAHRPAIDAPTVRWFHVGGSGTDHLAGYDAERVTLTTCAGVLAPFLGERALAALLYISTGLAETVRSNRVTKWNPTRFESLQGQTVLVVGAGAAGSEFARRLRPFGCRIVGIRASAESDPHFDEMHRPDALDGWLPRANVLSLHVPLNASTRGLMDERRLRLLPGGALVLNSSRGAVLDEAALVAGLDAQLDAPLGGAWLDVFEVEPLPASSPLWDHPRVLVTPHCADQVSDYPRRFAQRFASVWQEHLGGGSPVVNSCGTSS